MKSWDVFLDTFVNVLLPDDVDPETSAGTEAIYEAAIQKFRERLADPGQVSLTWERYEEGDEE